MMKKQKYSMPCKGCVDKIPEQRTHGPWWLPGIVVVEFKQHVSPGSLTQFHDAKFRKDLYWLDIEGLQNVIRDRMVKPPKWTFAFTPEKPPTESHYRRFITFYLDADMNVPEVSKRLGALRGVVSASGEPKISPPLRRLDINEEPPDPCPMSPLASTLSGQPQPLLMEPLAVSGGQALGMSVITGTQDLRNQWYLFRCQADQLINDGITGAGVVVAAVDWGVNIDHQELVNRIAFSYNASRDNADVSSGPFRFHGTATLGLIGAGDNDAGMLGFASGAELWAIQGQDEGENIDNSCWARAIEEARTQSSNGKRKVILVEASTDSGFNIESSPSVAVPISTAINNDNCVVCVAAGDAGVNAGLKENNQPITNVTGSILVGATKYKLDPTVVERAQSNWGNRVVVSAPGASTTDVTSCDCGNNTYTNRFGGTSGAAAKVAGAMALLLEKFPELTHQQIVDVLRDMPQIPAIQGKTIGTFLDLSTIVSNISLLPGM